MLKQTLIAAVFTVGLTNAFSSQQLNLDQIVKQKNGAEPGSVQMYLDVSSASSILKYVTAFGPYYSGIIGKQIDINFDTSFAGIDLHINNATVTDFMIADGNMAFVGDSNTIRTTITGIDVTLAVDANATSWIPKPLDVTEVKISNMTIQFDLSTTSEDQVHWQLVDSNSLVSLGDFNVKCAEPIWQKAFDKVKPEMMDVINYGLKLGEGVVEGLVDVLNYELANEGESTFVFNLKGMPFNMTMTQAPEFSNADNRMTFHVAGEFVDAAMEPSTDAWTDYSSQTPEQVDQIWIHQSTVNSLIYDLNLPLSGEGFDNQLFALMSELKTYYGADASCSGVASFPKEANSEPVTMTAADGIIVGDVANGGLVLNLDIFCAKDATSQKELSATLTSGMHLLAYFLWDNFEVTAKLTEPQFMNTQVTSHIGELDYHNWDSELTAVLKNIADDVTLRFGNGVDLKNITVVRFLSGIARGTLMSPFIKDEFLFAGWRMITDPNPPKMF